MREVREIGKEYIEEYLDLYLNAYPAYKDLDDACFEKYRKRILYDMEHDTDICFVGLFEDDNLLATMKIVSYQMNIFGKIMPAAGLMSLAVHYMHKKKGAALDMVRYFERFTIEHEMELGILLPFNVKFYRNMGYGYSGKMEEYHIPTEFLPKMKDMSMLRPLKATDLADMMECQRQFAIKNNGMCFKHCEEIYNIEHDTVSMRIGYYDGDVLKGYVSYRLFDDSSVNYTFNRMSVDEIVYDNGEVLRALLGFLRLQADMAQHVVIRTGEEDFHYLLDSCQDVSGNYISFGYMQTNVSAVGIMHKIMEPEKFIKDTGYRVLPPYSLTLRINYEDELNHENKSLTIDFVKNSNNTASSWKLAEEGTVADVTADMEKSDLSSLLLGSCHLASLVRLGIAKISNDEYTDILDSLFHYNQKPWVNTDF